MDPAYGVGNRSQGLGLTHLQKIAQEQAVRREAERPPAVVVLIPAHNEEEALPGTLAGLMTQSRRPDRVIVVCDNCTDSTAELAELAGAEVFHTRGNRRKKAGALNQALGVVLPELGVQDVIMVVDADTTVSARFTETALKAIAKGAGACGGVFYGEPGGGLLGSFQRAEYCQPPGTMVTRVVGRAGAPGGAYLHEQVPIEDIGTGDRVVSLHPRGSWKANGGSFVSEVARREFAGELVRVVTESGLTSRYTPNHWCAVRIGDSLDGRHVVYMIRKNGHYRVGKTKGITGADSRPQLGFMTRYHRERADAVWVLSVHDSDAEASQAARQAQFEYALPGTIPVGGVSWTELKDNRDRASDCLRAHGRDIDLPLWADKYNPQESPLRLRSMNFINAANLWDGMVVLPEHDLSDGKKPGYYTAASWVPVRVTREDYKGPVYSIEVDDHHTYFADGIATHNCRYARQLDRTQRQARVLTGTATAFTVPALRALAEARASGRLPGVQEGAAAPVYTMASLTEDGEITLALKTLGFRCVSPGECRVTTEIMTTWKSWWKQRTRWQRGALEDLRTYGWTKVTLPYILRQWLMGLSVAVFALYVVYSLVTIALYGYHTNVFWLSVSAVFIVERVVTVRRSGWREMLTAGLIFPELFYDAMQHIVWLTCVAGSMLRTRTEW